MRRALLLWAAAATVGCGTESNREALTDALLEYTHGMRWSRSDWVRPYLPKDLRPGLDPTALPPGLQLITCEVEAVNLAADSKQAAVRVSLEWYLAGQGSLRSTLLEQSWRLEEGRWKIVDQRTVRGSPYPPRATTERISRR